MIYSNFTPSKYKNQLTLDLPAHLLPGYPVRGLLRCMALCAIYGWPDLGDLAAGQLAKVLGGGR